MKKNRNWLDEKHKEIHNLLTMKMVAPKNNVAQPTNPDTKILFYAFTATHSTNSEK